MECSEGFFFEDPLWCKGESIVQSQEKLSINLKGLGCL